MNPLAPGFNTVHRNGIKFYREHFEDPEEKVKQNLFAIIAAANEPFNGVENFWRTGCGTTNWEGRVPYPDFGRYISKEEFKAFKTAFPRIWADPSLWYLEGDDAPWELFDPFIQLWNEKMGSNFKTETILVSLCLF